MVSEEHARPETKAEAKLHPLSPVRPIEANAIAIEFPGAHLRVPVCRENFLATLRVILESLK
jgi:hypothetical protein